MKATLEALKAVLQQGIAYIRQDDVFIAESLDVMSVPEAVSFPAIALKDGPISRSELASGMWEVTLQVRIALLNQLFKPEATLMGDASSSQKGLIDIAADVHALLDENLLGIEGIQSAFSPSEGEAETVGNDTDLLQRKVITYEYTKQEVRP